MKVIMPEIKGMVKKNEPLCKHTTFHIGGPAKYWIEPGGHKGLKKFVLSAKRQALRFIIIGSGSNILAGDKKYEGAVVKLTGPEFEKIVYNGVDVEVGSGVLLSKLIVGCCKKSLSGLEGLTGIPGTVGGAIRMNAGYKSSIGDVIKKIWVMDRNGKVRTFTRNKLALGYRRSGLEKYIILKALLRLKKGNKVKIRELCESHLKRRISTQPMDKKSAGCVFKNPVGHDSSAGEIIELCGLKGKRIGGASISRKHANYIINDKFAKAVDVLGLIKEVRQIVKSKTGIDLELEVVLI